MCETQRTQCDTIPNYLYDIFGQQALVCNLDPRKRKILSHPCRALASQLHMFDAGNDSSQEARFQIAPMQTSMLEVIAEEALRTVLFE